jgi:hypothetical protein
MRFVPAPATRSERRSAGRRDIGKFITLILKSDGTLNRSASPDAAGPACGRAAMVMGSLREVTMHDPDSEWEEIWRAAINVIGFHDLAEMPEMSELQKLQFHAQVYASGVELARRLIKLRQQD